jgi:hypothetical protein
MILYDFAFLSLKKTGNSDVSILYTFLCNLVLYSNVTMSHACTCTQKAALYISFAIWFCIATLPCLMHVCAHKKLHLEVQIYLIHQFPLENFRLLIFLVNLILRLLKLYLVFLLLIGLAQCFAIHWQFSWCYRHQFWSYHKRKKRKIKLLLMIWIVFFPGVMLWQKILGSCL